MMKVLKIHAFVIFVMSAVYSFMIGVHFIKAIFMLCNYGITHKRSVYE